MFENFRRQFILTDSVRELHAGWTAMMLVGHVISRHADLPIQHLRDGGRGITLVGYAIDPAQPTLSDEQIVRVLLNNCSSAQDVVTNSSTFGGRWAIIAEFPEQDIVVHDACALRQVFYSDATLPAHFCASQAIAAAKFFDLDEDERANRGFLKSDFVQNNDEYWWPGDSTRFRGVRCLLPNHYLDLRTREAHRFAPAAPVGHLPLETAAIKAGNLLKTLVTGVSHRYPLALPLTAGWDSRTILAACRAANIVPYSYTLRFGDLDSFSQDLNIPHAILRSLGWPHHVIDCPEIASSQFAATYNASVDPTSSEACAIGMGIRDEYPSEYLSMSGHCSEAARCYYHPSERTGEITAKDLAEMTGMDCTPFVHEQFENWIRDAEKPAAAAGIDLLDLFYWEQRSGRWAANGQSQWDLVHERFTPFNCRALLLTLLSADVKYRRPPDYLLYREIIRGLSPDLLAYPFNPETQMSYATDFKTRGFVQRAIAKLRSYQT